MIAAATAAALLSGVPSAVVNVMTGRPVLEPVRAAGALVGREGSLVGGAIAHAAISTWWAAVLWRVLPARGTVAWGAASGVGIAALDLGLIGRRIPAIRRLPWGRQVLDHIAFGTIIGWARAATANWADPRAR